LDLLNFKRLNTSFMINHFKKQPKNKIKYRCFTPGKVLLSGPSGFSTSLSLPASGISPSGPSGSLIN
jgi:hypothetical protein